MSPLRLTVCFFALFATLGCNVLTSSNRTCTAPDSCTAFTGVAWTDGTVRDQCASRSATYGNSGCAGSSYGTCVVLEGTINETRVYVYTEGATEALVEEGCCSTAGSTATWVSASGERRACPSGGGLDEGI